MLRWLYQFLGPLLGVVSTVALLVQSLAEGQQYYFGALFKTARDWAIERAGILLATLGLKESYENMGVLVENVIASGDFQKIDAIVPLGTCFNIFLGALATCCLIRMTRHLMGLIPTLNAG